MAYQSTEIDSIEYLIVREEDETETRSLVLRKPDGGFVVLDLGVLTQGASETELETLIRYNTPEVVEHGYDADFPRPDKAPGVRVTWVGYITPTNALNHDDKYIVDAGKPLAPSNIIITSRDTANDVFWIDPEAPDLDIIVIQRSVDGDPFVDHDTVAAGVQTWTDEGLVNGKRYSYKLIAKDLSGNPSADSITVVRAPDDLPDKVALYQHWRADSLHLVDQAPATIWDGFGPTVRSLLKLAGLDPVFHLNSGNGMPGVGFVRSSDNLPNTGTRMEVDVTDLTGPWSLFMVVKVQHNGGMGVLATSIANTDPTFAVSRVSQTIPWQLATSGLAANITNGGPETLSQFALVEVRSGPVEGTQLLINGVEVTTNKGANMLTKTALKIERIGLGALRNTLASYGSSTMIVNELVLFTAEKTDAEAAVTRQYIAGKHLVTVV